MSDPTQPLLLIVEDEPAQLVLLSYNLTAAGFRLITATDGEEAALFADEEQPD